MLAVDEVKTGFGRSGGDVRGPALGGRTGPDVPRQGDGRRRRPDRRRARQRAGDGRLRGPADRLDLVLAAVGLRRGAGDARRLRARTGAGERAGAGAGRRRAPGGDGREVRLDRRDPGDRRLPGDRVRPRPGEQGARPRAAGAGRPSRGRARGADGLELDLAQHPALAADGAGGVPRRAGAGRARPSPRRPGSWAGERERLPRPGRAARRAAGRAGRRCARPGR